MQTYMLELETLLYILEESEQNGILSAELVAGVPGFKERCRAKIGLRAGKIAACELEGTNGRILIAGMSALRALSNLGVQEWQLLENQSREQLSPAQTSDRKGEQSERYEKQSRAIGPVLPVVAPIPPSFTTNEPDRRTSSLLSFIPHRVASVNGRALEQLPRSHRRVLSLVDGSRNIERISFLLSSSSGIQNNQQLWKIMKDLEIMGMIRIEER
jgi:hypothetical protein